MFCGCGIGIGFLGAPSSKELKSPKLNSSFQGPCNLEAKRNAISELYSIIQQLCSRQRIEPITQATLSRQEKEAPLAELHRLT